MENNVMAMSRYREVQDISSLIILKPHGELLTKHDRQNIGIRQFEAIETWCRGEKVIYETQKPEEFVWETVRCDGCTML
ncbi:unnamed protein product [Didymodactylos carnosus]|uniref:Uncharacterized protein n=1 Tax=Didymodactylos carnosus TaxID=1234261 RepID=A0A814UVY8_9BILA|nr:unnamed protein product [Didymodactylos carnosus]CAF1529613.1 unnamed protein product [Didymodactylos carnosus]CAF3945751.1 unnamed protein product [Didymodactylos carnosus]CAF4316385.1 unnamed protein product [Didymodactylos carnosus]